VELLDLHLVVDAAGKPVGLLDITDLLGLAALDDQEEAA
jgi:signal-transduction protein with cAMP-binding, CBS, and nucleotidyltransferase domain